LRRAAYTNRTHRPRGIRITADTALRLAKFFGMSVEFWINLQTQYDLEIAKRSIAKELKAIAPVRKKGRVMTASRRVANRRRQRHRGNQSILCPGRELRVLAQRVEAARCQKGGSGMCFPILRRERKRLRGFR